MSRAATGDARDSESTRKSSLFTRPTCSVLCADTTPWLEVASGSRPSQPADAEDYQLAATATRQANNRAEEGLCEAADTSSNADVVRAPLPFCYLMYTSGSTGVPAGVCGTEEGAPCLQAALGYIPARQPCSGAVTRAMRQLYHWLCVPCEGLTPPATLKLCVFGSSS